MCHRFRPIKLHLSVLACQMRKGPLGVIRVGAAMSAFEALRT